MTECGGTGNHFFADHEPVYEQAAFDSADAARDAGMMGWNLRCNRCGSFGAEWLDGERPGWGALALCPPHAEELRAEYRRHQGALHELRAVNFHQPPHPSPRYVYD